LRGEGLREHQNNRKERCARNARILQYRNIAFHQFISIFPDDERYRFDGKVGFEILRMFSAS
jgi:hypothetical protein